MKFSVLAGGVAVLFGIDVCAGTAPFKHEKSYTLPSGKRVATVFRERLCNPGECSEVDSGIWGIDGGVPLVADDPGGIFFPHTVLAKLPRRRPARRA